MRVEQSKNNGGDNRQTRDVKSGAAAQNSLVPSKTLDAPPPTTSAFAKILEETRRENGKDNQANNKKESAAKTTDSSDAKRAEDSENSVGRKDEAREKDGRRGDGRGDGRGEEDDTAAAFAALGALPNDIKTAAEFSPPAARSMLHVADLERIISAVRTQAFNDAKQVIIALKNSVLEGLQIKLTLAENGRLKAEFIALNEQIKKQLDARKGELSDILKKRSTSFTDITVVLSGEDEDEDRKNQSI